MISPRIPLLALCAVVVACGAETSPFDGPGIIVQNGDGDAAAEAGDASAAVDGSSGTSFDGGHGFFDGAGGVDGQGTGTSGEGGATTSTTCAPVSLMPVPTSGGAACAGSSSSSCFPHSETSFSAVWVPPVPRSHPCSSTQIDAFYTACVGSTASGSNCGSWTTSTVNLACRACLETPSSATSYGVLIAYPGNVVELNEAGCVALAEPCNLPCAETWLASVQCREAACAPTFCPNQSDQIACATQAAACSACEGYAQVSSCMTDLSGPSHPAGMLCSIGSSATPTQAEYTAVAAFMCGP